MAWFNRKKNGDGGDDSGQPPALQIQPEKAGAWFKQARHAADTRNYAYAIDCFLHGIKFDPTDMKAHENLLEVANVYRSTGGSTATGKELRSMLGDKRPLDRLAAAELAWVKDALNPPLALKCAREAADLGLDTLGRWISERGAIVLLKNKKATKAMWVDYLEVFEQIGAFDLAVRAGENAITIDRSDAHLVTRIRNLSAQATMDKGRYDSEVGEQGGFRQSIRDAEGQRQLIEDESMAVDDETAARRLARAKEEYEKDPDDGVTVKRYAGFLVKDGTEESELEAARILNEAYKQSGEYRFRVQSTDIQIVRGRRQARELRDQAEESGVPEDQERYEKASRQLLEYEIKQFQERAEKYPTDLSIKFTLGEKLYELGEHDEAIPHLQQAQQDARIRARAQHLIGLCFLNQEWFDEAVESLREATETYEIKDDDTHLGMRYDLMQALRQFAEENDDLEAADDAVSLAKGIALRNLNFRDIRQEREVIRKLLKNLKSK